MSVYFIEAVDLGLVKIGTASSPKERLIDLQTASPSPLRLIREIPGSFKTEHDLHVRFNEKRIRGEWFSLSRDDIASCNGIEMDVRVEQGAKRTRFGCCEDCGAPKTDRRQKRTKRCVICARARAAKERAASSLVGCVCRGCGCDLGIANRSQTRSLCASCRSDARGTGRRGGGAGSRFGESVGSKSLKRIADELGVETVAAKLVVSTGAVGNWISARSTPSSGNRSVIESVFSIRDRDWYTKEEENGIPAQRV